MANLFSSEEMAEYEIQMDNLFDSWARPVQITLYKHEGETVFNFSSDFNDAWDDQLESQITTVEKKETFYVRLIYPNSREGEKKTVVIDRDTDARAAQNLGVITIQCKEDCYQFVKDATRAEYLGEFFSIKSDIRKIGLFDFKYYVITLQKQP